MVRAITVIGHGVNLLPHYINHYLNYVKVDEIQIVVYETEMDSLLANDVKEIIANYDNVKIVRVHRDRIFDWEKVTMLYNYITKQNPNDWWVIADIDEFHLYPNDNLPKLISNCNEYGWEVVRGGFIDRIGRGGEFVELKNDESIWEQFPNAGFFRYPMSNACPNKICVKKGHIEITPGQHYAKINGQTTWRWQGWNHPLINPHSTVQVHHFKWDKTSIERIQEVASIKKEYSFSDEYQLMYEQLRKTKFKINVTNPEFMFELGVTIPQYNQYRNWGKLINKIISI